MISERTGEQQLQTDLSKVFKPITETQKATSREITEGLKPITEGIENLPQAITFIYVGKIAKTYLKKFTTKDEADRTYGLNNKAGKFYIGNKLAIIVDNDLVVGKDEYEGTPGLWELIVSEEPKDFTKEDYENYAKLMVKTNTLYSGYNPENKRPKSSKGYKWNTILMNILVNRKRHEGSGVIVIPSDPNALLERLDLSLASQEAGHTGVRNELVSICDELKRQGVLDLKAYKKLNSIIKK